jgi:hypothetical protein
MPAIEKHYTCLELAELWQLAPDTIRSLFRETPGVLRIVRPERRNKRGYTSLRIPESVAQKRHTELNGKAVA